MAEPLTARAYEMLWSPYDQTWHVFVLNQSAMPIGRLFVTVCGHSVPTRLVERTPPGSVCPPCEGAPGARLPDMPQLWMAR